MFVFFRKTKTVVTRADERLAGIASFKFVGMATGLQNKAQLMLFRLRGASRHGKQFENHSTCDQGQNTEGDVHHHAACEHWKCHRSANQPANVGTPLARLTTSLSACGGEAVPYAARRLCRHECS